MSSVLTVEQREQAGSDSIIDLNIKFIGLYAI